MKSVASSRLAKRLQAWTSGPTDAFLFDHVPRTGGSYFAEILEQLVGPTSENFDCGPNYPHLHAEEIRRLDRYQVVAGHMRLDTVNAFRAIRPRRLITLVREPAAQIESVYTFWRYNILEDLPHCNLAKKLSFGEFIRTPDLRMAVDNPMTRHLLSLWDLNRIEVSETSRAMALKMADSYELIGVTERMDETVAAFRKLFRTRSVHLKTHQIDRNASKGRTVATPEDLEFLREQNELDYLIYKRANDRLDKILSHG